MYASSSKRLPLFGLVTLLAILPACGKRTASQLNTHGKSKIVTGSVLAAVATGAAVAGGSTVVEAGLGPVPITCELAHALYFLLPLAIIAAPIAVALIVSGNDDCKKARSSRRSAKRNSDPDGPRKSEQTPPAKLKPLERKAVKYTYIKVSDTPAKVPNAQTF